MFLRLGRGGLIMMLNEGVGRWRLQLVELVVLQLQLQACQKW